jgi:CheY-like chemotaxis protein
VVVLDHHLPGMSGVQAVPSLRSAGIEGPILLFTRFLTEAMPEIRVPLDVWPVSKANPDGVLELLGAYRASAAPCPSISV